MENNEFKKVCFKNCTCYYFDDIFKLEYFDIDIILTDGKLYDNILNDDISYKTLVRLKPRFNKIDGLLKIMMGLNFQHCLALKNMMLFRTELDTL